QSLLAEVTDEPVTDAQLADAEGAYLGEMAFKHYAMLRQLPGIKSGDAVLQLFPIMHELLTEPGPGTDLLDSQRPAFQRPLAGPQGVGGGEGAVTRQHTVAGLLHERLAPPCRRGGIRFNQGVRDSLFRHEWMAD